MPRPPRIEVPDGIYHVISQGSNKGTIFFDDVGRSDFLAMVARIVRKYEWILYAYCLMNTHYHVVLRIPLGVLSNGMKELNGGYSRRMSVRYGRTRHLFANRFFGRLVETEEQLLEAVRYTVLNPVRGGACGSPEEWAWSSYCASAGFEPPPPFLARRELLALFDDDPVQATTAFRQFVAAGHVPVSDTVTEV